MGLRGQMDISKLMKKLEEVAPAFQQPVKTLVDVEAGRFVTSSGKTPGMAQVTPPAHDGVTGRDAQQHGEWLVKGDIRRIYADPGRAYNLIRAACGRPAADAFWLAINGHTWLGKGGKIRKGKPALDEARRLVRSLPGMAGMEVAPFDGGRAHEVARRKGRVGINRGVALIVTNWSAVKQYIKVKQKNVGIYAASLGGIASTLGVASRLPGYIRRHGTRFGGGVARDETSGYIVILTMRVPFAEKDFIRRSDYVVKYRLNALRRQMPHVIRKALKASQLAA